jgi:transcriptional regulator with XRE-family HTH domain/quercetin dioxygenase-like cupin family protein
MTTSSQPPGVEGQHIVNLGARLRDGRVAAGLSLRELARRLGVSPSFVSQIENGKSQPSVATLYALAQLLDLSIDRLFWTDVPAPAPDVVAHLGDLETSEPTPQPEEMAPDADATVEDSMNARPAGLSAREPRDIPDPRLTRREPDKGERRKPSDTQSRLSVTSPGNRARLELVSGVIWEQLARNTGPDLDFVEITYPPGSDSTTDGRALQHEGYEYGYLVAGELQATVGFDTFALKAGEALGFNSSVPHRFLNLGATPARGIWFRQSNGHNGHK